MYLGHVGELRYSHLDRNLLSCNAVRQSAAVEALKGESQGRLHVGTQTDAFGQQRRRCAVRAHQTR